MISAKAAELQALLYKFGIGHHKPRTAWIMGICNKEHDDVIKFRKFYASASDPEEAREFVSDLIDEAVVMRRLYDDVPDDEVYNNGVSLIGNNIIGNMVIVGSMVDRGATILYSAIPEENI